MVLIRLKIWEKVEERMVDSSWLDGGVDERSEVSLSTAVVIVWEVAVDEVRGWRISDTVWSMVAVLILGEDEVGCKRGFVVCLCILVMESLID